MDRRDLPLRDQVTLLEQSLHEAEVSIADLRAEVRAAEGELDAARAVVGAAWCRPGVALAEAIETKCKWLERMSHGPEAG